MNERPDDRRRDGGDPPGDGDGPSGTISDREFEAYLVGDSELSRHWQSQAPEWPDGETDRAIRREARAAAGGGAGWRWPRLWSRSWTVPVAGAATILLAVGVVLDILSSGPDRLSLPAGSPTAPPLASESVVPEPSSAGNGEQAAKRAASGAASQERLAIDAGPGRTRSRDRTEGAADAGLRGEERQRRRTDEAAGSGRAEFALSDVGLRAPEAEQDRDDFAPAPAEETVELAALPQAATSRSEVVPAAPPSPALQQAGASEDGAAAVIERLSRNGQSYLASREADEAILTRLRGQTDDAPPRNPAPPAAWVAAIDAALDDGDRALATTLLGEFRRVYPEYPVSDRIQGLEAETDLAAPPDR